MFMPIMPFHSYGTFLLPFIPNTSFNYDYAFNIIVTYLTPVLFRNVSLSFQIFIKEFSNYVFIIDFLVKSSGVRDHSLMISVFRKC